MSSDLSAIHAQTSAILERLYDERGQPDQLDNAFIEDYFKLVKDDLNLDDEPGVAPLAPHATTARLSQQQRGLTEVVIPSKSEKFLVTSTASVKNISGTSQRFGSARGRGTYVMTDVKGVPNITIKTGSAVVLFIGVPTTVKAESGKGEWVKT